MSMSEQSSSVASPAIKIATAWAAVGITSWSDVAALLASLYTALLIGEWMWKRAIRPYCEQRGWVKRQLRRRDD
jgi:hypothetical protein